MGARIAPPLMEATDTSRLVCVVVVSYQEYSLTHTPCLVSCRAREFCCKIPFYVNGGGSSRKGPLGAEPSNLVRELEPFLFLVPPPPPNSHTHPLHCSHPHAEENKNEP